MQELLIYIQSGILELYVVGDLPPIEMMVIEKLVQKYDLAKIELEKHREGT